MLLGLDRVAMAGGGSANPYQTSDNALIFQLDGIWNNGLNKHSASPDGPMDIAGGHALTASGSLVWGADYIGFNGTEIIKIDDPSDILGVLSGDSVTIQIVVSLDVGAIAGFGITSRGFWFWRNSGASYFIFNFRQGRNQKTYTSDLASITVNGERKYIINGESDTFEGVGTNTPSGDCYIGRANYVDYAKMNLRAFRVYSKILSADEMKTIAQLDHDRFGTYQPT